MCSPQLAAAGGQAGMSMIGNVVNYFAIQSAHHAAVQAANLNFNMKAEQADKQNVQIGQQETEQNLTDAVKQAQSFGRIAVTASALGLGDYSTRQLTAATYAAHNRNLGINTRNADQARGNLQTELTGASIQRSTEISNAPHTNLGQLALSLGKSAAGGATTYADLGGKFGMTPAGGPGLPGGTGDGFRQGRQGEGLYSQDSFIG